MVRLEGFEPPTCCSGATRLSSILYIDSHRFQAVTQIRGICFRSKAEPVFLELHGTNRSFATVLLRLTLLEKIHVAGENVKPRRPATGGLVGAPDAKPTTSLCPALITEAFSSLLIARIAPYSRAVVAQMWPRFVTSKLVSEDGWTSTAIHTCPICELGFEPRSADPESICAS